MSTKIKIGFVCEKGTGHFEFYGDPDAGGCGSHNVADIYIEIPDEIENDTEAVAAIAGAQADFIKKLEREAELRAEDTKRFFAEEESKKDSVRTLPVRRRSRKDTEDEA